jgi:hypothetical protein
VTRLYAARVAARLRRELNADVDMIRGRYGVFKVVVDGDTVIDGGGAAFLGIMPSQVKILGAVRKRVARRPTPDAARGAATKASESSGE